MGIVVFNRAAFYPWFKFNTRSFCPENSLGFTNISYPFGKIALKLGKNFSLGLILATASLLFSVSVRSATTISFKLDEPCRTSAGVYKTDGSLVRTLWSNTRYYAAGTYTATWDGKDDQNNAVAAGTYVMKVLQNNVNYVWDGVVGNSSNEPFGLGVHRGFEFIHDMAITGTNAFYCSGYNEGQYGQRMFYTTDPQRVQNAWNYVQYSSKNSAIQNLPGIANRYWWFMAADDNYVYCACQSCYNWNNGQVFGYAGCIIATKVSDQSRYVFSSGTAITNTGESFPSGIYAGAQPGLSGLAVQRNSNVLAAAVAPDNKIYLFNKTTGAAITSISINAPGRMNFDANGNLWVTTSNSVVCLTNLNDIPAVALTITTGLVAPLAVAANSPNPNLILVADGGNSQQIKAFDANGTALWTYGLAGGYQSNGIAVANNKFWFNNNGNSETFISFAPDGSFWVGDAKNDRALHFDGTRNYLEQITYQPHKYSVAVDKTNPSRVFSGFLEFNVDYSKPLAQSWTLINNWEANVDTNHIGSGGFYNLQTFSNGHTYALIDNLAYNNTSGSRAKELCELTAGGLRFTGIFPATNATSVNNSFGLNGAAMSAYTGGNNYYSQMLTGYDSSFNPKWGPLTNLATAPTGGTNPQNQNIASFKTVPVTSSGIVIVFDDSIHPVYHLGGIQTNGSSFLWRASPAGAYFDGHGTYEISNGVNYAGSDVQALDRHVVFGYHGEFFRYQTQAGQHLHYYDDGLFIGQFGEPFLGYPPGYAVPGFVGNGFGPVMVKTNGEYYCFENDESAHGVQRWHLVNANNVRELANTVSLNGSTTLTNPVMTFPTAVTGLSENQGAQINWNAVIGAMSYNVRYSTNNGGPFVTLVNTPASHALINGLVNGQIYYFTVSAVVDGSESVASEQVKIMPFDPGQSVVAAGRQAVPMSQNALSYVNGSLILGVNVMEVNSNNPALGLPSFLDTVHLANSLTLQDEDNYGFGNLLNETIGTKGYVIYNWGGNGVHLSNVLQPFTVTLGSGWVNQGWLLRQFYVNGRADVNYPANYGIGLAANPLGTINIGVSDTNHHTLTVICPAPGSGARNFTVGLASDDGTSAQYVVNDFIQSGPTESSGASQVFQFLFKGNSTLTVDATGGANNTLQALFLDDVMVASGSSLQPPAQFHTIGQ